MADYFQPLSQKASQTIIQQQPDWIRIYSEFANIVSPIHNNLVLEMVDTSEAAEILSNLLASHLSLAAFRDF